MTDWSAAEDGAEPEVGAMEPENRARSSDRSARVRTQRVRPLRRRRSAAAPILLAAGIVVVGVALSLLLARTSRSRGGAGVRPGPARGVSPGPARGHGGTSPEPVVTPMLPAEPAVTPLDEPGEQPPPVKARPVEHQR